MRKFVLLLTGFLLATFSANASETSVNTTARYDNYGKSFIFNEGGVEFSVYADGQFDFYLNGSRNGVSVNVNIPGVNISFNSGFNYDSFVQYDDYGAVVQIEDVPVFYDHYGRIKQAGDVFINYNRWGRISRVGGLYLNYNSYGDFLNCSGYINRLNRRYVYRPFHAYFALPIVDRCVVWNNPYRRFYSPYRFSYTVYRNNYYNGYYSRSYRTRNYCRPGSSVRNFNRGRRVASARNVKFRSRDNRRTMYQRNDRNYRKINRSRSRVASSTNRNVNRSRTVTRNTRVVSRDRNRAVTRNVSKNSTQTRERSINTIVNRSKSRTPIYNRTARNKQTQKTRGYSRNRSVSKTTNQNSRYNSRKKTSRSNTSIAKRGTYNRSKRNTTSRSRVVRGRR